jgi:hypothetical protein
VTAILGLIGVIFALAQLPVQLAGFPETVKSSLDVIEDIFGSKTAIVSAHQIGNQEVSSLNIATAVDDFGEAESRIRRGYSCTLRWPAKGLEILFIATTGDTCNATESLFCAGYLTDHHWETEQGLHVGDSLEKLHRIYPSAIRNGQPAFDQEWTLDSGTLGCPLSPNRHIAGLRAETIGDNVNQLEIYYFAGGE